jgi:hypothetical protein
MTIPHRIIEKAISGGWENPLPQVFAKISDDHKEQFHAEVTTIILWNQFAPLVICDPLFWQALGKALGWPKVSAYPRESDNEHETWRVTAIAFYDLILTGGDTDAYWNDILPTP